MILTQCSCIIGQNNSLYRVCTLRSKPVNGEQNCVVGRPGNRTRLSNKRIAANVMGAEIQLDCKENHVRVKGASVTAILISANTAVAHVKWPTA